MSDEAYSRQAPAVNSSMLKILVISTWFGVWLINFIRFYWIIVGFFILTKLLAFTFFLEDISPSLIFVIQNILISNNFHRENSGLLQEICVLSGSLSEISAELKYLHYYLFIYLFIYLWLLLLFRIHLLLLLLVLLICIIII